MLFHCFLELEQKVPPQHISSTPLALGPSCGPGHSSQGQLTLLPSTSSLWIRHRQAGHASRVPSLQGQRRGQSQTALVILRGAGSLAGRAGRGCRRNPARFGNRQSAMDAAFLEPPGTKLPFTPHPSTPQVRL